MLLILSVKTLFFDRQAEGTKAANRQNAVIHITLHPKPSPREGGFGGTLKTAGAMHLPFV
jgi:hypothetical protein